MSDNDIKYPEIEVQLTGEDGNAFYIMGTVSKALKRGLRETHSPEEIDSIIEEYYSESQSGDYNNLLVTAMKYVTVL